MTETIALEVIATSLDDALAAEEGGAARIELVAAFDRGGMTPPLFLLDQVLARVSIPARVMVRLTESHEVPDPAVRKQLIEQAVAVGQRPIDGLVFGAVAEARIDEALLAAISAAARCPITFHRAFEAVADPDAALTALQHHPAVDRVLWDGGTGQWPARARAMGAWSARAGPGLQVLPGGGVTEEALAAIAREPALREVHVGRLVREPATADGAVSARRVAAVVARLGQLRLASSR